MPKTTRAPSASKAGEAKINRIRWPQTILLFILFVVIIRELYYWSAVPVIYRAVLALVSLVVVGEMLIRINGFLRLTAGIYMVRSLLGLKRMDLIARKHPRFWNALADWGMVMGFGILAYVFFRKDISRKSIVFGIISLVFVLFFVIPQSLLAFSFLNLPQITSRVQSGASAGAGGISYLGIVIYALSIFGGFVLYVIAALAYNAATVVYGIVLALAGIITTGTPNYTGVSSSIPGVAPIIPGITIPLAAGLLAFAVVIIFHEFSHGILARISKVRVNSSGLLMYGIIPIGAFVEPEEKSIGRLSRKEQNRISVAGVSANMLIALIMAVPMLLLYLYVMPHLYSSYVYIQGTVPGSAASVMKPGSAIIKWDGYAVNSISDFKIAARNDTAGAVIPVVTSNGTYSLTANSTGKVGVYVVQGVLLGAGVMGSAISFAYTFFSLAFLLSLFIALVNYLPLPSFDGWRIFNASIKNKRLVNYITAFVILVIILNALPWLWILF